MKIPGPLRAAIVTASIIILICAGLFVGIWYRTTQIPPEAPHLTVFFPNVPEGNPVVIETPDGKFIVVDSGSETDAKTMVYLLRRLGIDSIDLLILTSHRYTALGAVPTLLQSHVQIRSVWESGEIYNGRAYRAANFALQQLAIPIRTVHAGDEIEVGPMPLRLTILWPPEHGQGAQTDPVSCRVDFGNTAFLLHGSATAASEMSIVSMSGAKLSSSDQYCILQTANHGGDNATSAELLHWSTPEAAIITCASNEPPGPETLHRLQAAGASIWRTDLAGLITVTADGTSAPQITAGKLVPSN